MNIVIASRQRTKKINLRLLKQIARVLLTELEIENAELGIALVGAKEMARVNWNFLRHEGSTDVITFDHAEKRKAESGKASTANCSFVWTTRWPRRRNLKPTGNPRWCVTSSTAFCIWLATTI